MIDVSINAPGLDDTFLAGINECFPGWGDRQAYEWAFRRQASGPAPDLMVLRDGSELLAGSSVTYRTMRVLGGRSALVGIMTGSWTLPAARNRGCFSRVIDVSKELVREKRGALLLGFAKGTNPSIGRLTAAGSEIFPTRYVQTTAETPKAPDPGLRVRVLGKTAEVLDRAFRAFEVQQREGVCFTYANAAEWAAQLLGRRPNTYVAEVEGAGLCAVEEDGEFDRVAAAMPTTKERGAELLRAMLGRAQARGRGFFFYSCDIEPSDALAASWGLTATPGDWLVMLGDREVASELAGQPLHDSHDLRSAPAFGTRAFQSGDRM